MDPQSLFRMISRSRPLQTCLRNVSISRRLSCFLSSTQLSSQTTSTSSTRHAPSSRLYLQDMTMRRFSSYLKPPAEFPSKKSNSDPNAIRRHANEYLFSPSRHYDDNRTIFVGGMSKFTTVQSLYNYFLPFGTITGCRLARNKLTGTPMEYGFVEFETVQQAESVCESQPHVIDNQVVGIRLVSHKELAQKFKLFVGGLSKETSVETLRKYFSKFGQIVQCAIPRNEVNGSRGFGYVTLKSQEAAESTCAHPHVIDNQVVNVRLESRKELRQKFSLFVGGLSKETSVETLRKYFSKFGDVVECYIPRNVDNSSRGFGYVTLKSQEAINNALNSAPHCIDNKEVGVEQTPVRQREFTIIVQKLSPNTTNESLHTFYSRTSSKYGSSIAFSNAFSISAAANMSPECLNFSSSSVPAQLSNSTLKSDSELNTTRDKNPMFFIVRRTSDGDVFKKSDPNAIRRHANEYIFSPSRHYDDNRTIFVGGMSKFTTVQSLYNYFLPFGTITGCRLARNKLTGTPMEYGFVEFELIKQAESVCESQPHVIDDQVVGIRLVSHKELAQKFKLFVGGLSKETSVETLRKYFSKFGQIVQCAIPRNEVNGSRGFGYVTLKSQEAINNALNSSPHCIDNKNVNVSLAGPRQREFTIIVQKLSPNTTNESLRAFYSRFGELTQCNIKFDRQTGQSRGFGYVSFCSQKELNSAINVNPHIIDGVEVKLEYVTDEFDMIVTRLSPNITEKALRDHFSRYGKLRRCEILESLPGVRTGFVGFWKEKEVLQALADRPHTINGKRVNCYQKDQKFAVFIGNLPLDATDDSLFETFSKYGKLVHWEVKRDRNTNRSLRYGFVSFEKAEEVVQAANGGPHILHGRTLRVEPVKKLTLSKKSFK
ncbi:RNA recognition motif domain-containing protein [Ditylenchus destructor]|uniref:RNA recognition motif domain-containing protein n=1 Tax=Ditylenchus destructor TaxID=166010 RepID=A0AAD4QVM4_9BILA|nr:RNA recognition motif domain-containing protein [Ditylenchus destructor]